MIHGSELRPTNATVEQSSHFIETGFGFWSTKRLGWVIVCYLPALFPRYEAPWSNDLRTLFRLLQRPGRTAPKPAVQAICGRVEVCVYPVRVFSRHFGFTKRGELSAFPLFCTRPNPPIFPKPRWWLIDTRWNIPYSALARPKYACATG